MPDPPAAGESPGTAPAIAAELRLLDPDVRRDAPAVAGLLHPEFAEIGASGRLWSRGDILEAMPSWEPDASVVASEFVATSLGEGIVLLRYVCVGATGRTRRSSVWQRDGDRWRIRFHQGTPDPPEPSDDTGRGNG